jgi:thioredoxin 1
MSFVTQVGQAEFEQKAIQAEGLVLVDFSATWCGPCKRMLPELEAAAEHFKGKATFLKVDIDEAPDVAMRFGVQGIPNLTFLKSGQVVDVAVGLMPKAEIVSRVQKNL